MHVWIFNRSNHRVCEFYIMAQQLPLPLNTTRDASPEEVSEWEKKDFFRAGKFSAMVYFVIIPAIVQAVALGSMLVIFYINDKIF